MTYILAVDDEPISLLIMSECLAQDGYQIDQAADGEEAWALMQRNSYDLLILDRMMPRLDGLSLLKRIKADGRWPRLPVIMQTAAAKQQEVRDGLSAGAYYYLTKPYAPEALRVLVSAVVAELNDREKLREAGAHLQGALELLDHGEFVFHTLEEARDLAGGLSHLCRDDMGSAMGLLELLINAVEHGNLGVSYAEKNRLRQNYAWEEEIARRLTTQPWCERRARIKLRRLEGEIEFTVSDEGGGFDWQPFLELDPARAFDLNGRGIAMARMLGFSSLEYQGSGNVVVARAIGKPGGGSAQG